MPRLVGGYGHAAIGNMGMNFLQMRNFALNLGARLSERLDIFKVDSDRRSRHSLSILADHKPI
jgi:hypothetical protein